MTHHYRCTLKNTCGARATLPKQIELYQRRPTCPSCKKDTLKIDPAVDRWNKKQGTCNCDGYHFPHRKGTAPWCDHSATKPTDQDHQDRYHQKMFRGAA